MLECREFISFILLKGFFWFSALILQITGNQVAIEILQYGDIRPVVISHLESERSAVLLEVFLGEYDLFSLIK